MELRWKCKDCGLRFQTKAKLYVHRHESHILQLRDRSNICPYCHQHYTGNRQLHLKICPNLHHGHAHTEESKQKISEARKKWLREHPDKHPWKNKNKFKSVPCEKLKEILRKDYTFEEEYTDISWKHNYSLDIAFLDKKIAIEVNGTQHYNKDGNLSTYYQKRHDYLESEGWLILEVHYARCFNKDEIEKIKSAINERKPISEDEYKILFQNKRKSKEEKLLAHKLKLEKAIKNNKISSTDNRKIVWCKLPEEKWLERKAQIENSGVDLTKFGWVSKVMKITGLSKRVLENTRKHFKNSFKPYFIRKYNPSQAI